MDQKNGTDSPRTQTGKRKWTRRQAVGGALAAALYGARVPGGRSAQAVLKPGYEGEPIAISDEVRDYFLNDPRVPRLGRTYDRVVLAEFSDFRCPHCRTAAATLRRLRKRDDGFLMAFPSYPILGPDSVDLALLGLAAHKQGRYADWHFAVMTWPGRVRPSAAAEIAESIDLDAGRLLRDAQSEENEETLIRNQEIATALGVRGTPSFVVFSRNRPQDKARLLRGKRSGDEFMEIIRRQRKA